MGRGNRQQQALAAIPSTQRVIIVATSDNKRELKMASGSYPLTYQWHMHGRQQAIAQRQPVLTFRKDAHSILIYDKQLHELLPWLDIMTQPGKFDEGDWQENSAKTNLCAEKKKGTNRIIFKQCSAGNRLSTWNRSDDEYACRATIPVEHLRQMMLDIQVLLQTDTMSRLSPLTYQQQELRPKDVLAATQTTPLAETLLGGRRSR